ncbi:hypothetical protein HO173_004588 [Letharia columbiana]|uniref:Uncharacterized protein n=1 Tax=Letharia columbiana TaxID=112416 RepID=A0A8H6L668_9LECA|nr:uncharacterized protein HO173_004588 [Letharia columbiana]KAF6237120.1 hypothetical protein HO173_004588 [Letharia columbiana]
MTTNQSDSRKVREVRRRQRQHKRTTESNHGAIAEEPALQLARYFNAKDEEELRSERLSREAVVVLARLEEERQMMREALGVSGRVRDS